MDDFSTRLEEFSRRFGPGSVGKLEKECGFNKNTLTKKNAGINSTTLLRIVEKYPELNLDWIILGRGPIVIGKQKEERKENPLPLIPFDAVAGHGDTIYEDERVEDYYYVSEFKECDFLIRVKGDSMTPKFAGGDLLACRRVSDVYFLQWGRCYVVYTKSQGVMVKRLHPSEKEGCIKCVSENTKYAPFDVPMEDIVSVALVNGSISLE